jgi:hypothetical protein
MLFLVFVPALSGSLMTLRNRENLVIVISLGWRERMGVEPTEDLMGPPTDLKSAKSTGTHTLPDV